MTHPERLGPYRVVREIASGGMGSVYEGVHEDTGARHALKVLRFDMLGRVSPQELARFQREAESLGRLDHPHVVRIHAADLAGSPPYLAQDLLPGGTLEQRLAAGPLSTPEALELTVKLASGLAAAHATGILHRDLKPENVLFDELGEPRLVDFGVALTSGSSAQRLTESGSIVGTPAYMAPEQARTERREDQRTDVYGLGALLFAMLTGEPPVPPQATLLSTLALVAAGKRRSLHRLRPDLAADLCAVVMRALAVEPDQRFPDVAAFASALRAPPPPPRPRGLALAAAAALLLVLLCTLTYALAGHSPPAPRDEAPPVRPTDRAAEEQRLALDALRAGDGEAALPLIERALEGESAALWRRRRGLAHLLRADPAAARADLAGHKLGLVAARVEEQRLDLLAQSTELRRVPLVSSERYLELFALIERLVEDGRTLTSLDFVGSRLMHRTSETLVSALLELPTAALKTHEKRVLELLEQTSILQEPGAKGTRIARALILYEMHEGGDENLRQHPHLAEIEELLAVTDREGAPPRWALCLWGLKTDLTPVGDPRLQGPLPERLSVAELTGLEHALLRSAYLRAAGGAYAELWRGLGEEESPAKCRAQWDRLLSASQHHTFHAAKRSLESSHWGLLHLASVHLLALRVAPALEILEREAWAHRVYAQRKMLTLECGLLSGGDSSAAIDALDRLVAEHGDWRGPYSLRAAYRAARGDTPTADLDAARRAQNTVNNLQLPWREPEETERELRGEGRRKALARILASAPGPRPRPR